MKNNLSEFFPSRLLQFLIGLCFVFLFGSPIFGAAGDLDRTFGTGGKVIATIDDTQAAQDIAVQADGKIVLASATMGANGYSIFAVLRLNADGTTDTSFGSGGKVSISFGGFYNAGAYAVAIQPDGKIVVAGNASPGSTGYDFALARLNTDGSLDPTFGNGGKISFPVGIANDFISDMILQPDGKIVLVGVGYTQPNSDGAIVRLNSDGTFDTTFNGSGKLITPIGAGAANDGFNGVVLQPDGKIVAAGTDGADFAVLRFNTNGTFDATFNGSGKVITPIGTQRDTGKVIALQPDGKILVGGSANSGSGDEAALVRYNTNGSLDASFGSGGKLTLSVPKIFNSVIIAADGKIIAVGTGGDQSYLGDFTLTRLNPNGTLDQGFGNGGKVITGNGSGNITAYSAVAQPDGKILVAGSGVGNSIYSFAVVRYLTDSTLQRFPIFDFDGDGKADISVYRPDGGNWYILQSASGFTGAQFGISTDKIVPADYDGDGKTDLAVYRNGIWYLNRSSAGFTGFAFGDADDIPQPADFDGDGKADLAVYRPSNGTWYVFNLVNNQFTFAQFGAATDLPVASDYNGDGKADFAVFRPSSGFWYITKPTGTPAQSFDSVQLGQMGDKPVPSDYDGDGKTDIAVYRPSNGTWYLNRSAQGFAGVQFGVSTDLPVAADYDGDGRADIAVYRGGVWYLQQSTAGFTGVQFGAATDKPAPNAFIQQ